MVGILGNHHHFVVLHLIMARDVAPRLIVLKTTAIHVAIILNCLV